MALLLRPSPIVEQRVTACHPRQVSGPEEPRPGVLVARVVSGGQTGADRAALDVAVRLGIQYGGWCPRGGLAEDHTEPPGLLAAYPLLRETPSEEPAQRTTWNVRDSDATLVVTDRSGPLAGGTALTREVALGLGRPCLVASTAAPGVVLAWLRELRESLARPLVLNVAGPRESKEPGLFEAAGHLLEEVLGQRPPGGAASSGPPS
jgi:hypothetical protein